MAIESTPATNDHHEIETASDVEASDSSDISSDGADGTINDLLTDDCLLTIFSNLPLRDHLTTGQICTSWKDLLAKAISPVRRLTLLLGNNARVLLGDVHLSPALDNVHGADLGPMFTPPPLEGWSPKKLLLEGAGLDDRTVMNLIRYLPHIVHLEVVVNETSVQVLDSIIFLLKAIWGKNLVTLKIVADFNDEEEMEKEDAKIYISTQLHRLLSVINNDLPRLKNLTWHLWHYILPKSASTREQIYLPIFAQLERVYFYTNDRIEAIFDALMRFAVPNSRLAWIALPSPISNEKTLSAFFRLPILYSKLTSLSLHMSALRESNLHRFTWKFSNLTSIWIYIDPSGFGTLLKYLAALKHLVFLQVSLHYPSFRVDLLSDLPEWYKDALNCTGDLETKFPRLRRPLFNTAPTQTLARLPTVKALYIRLQTTSHDDPSTLPIHTHFPNLQVLQLHTGSRHCTKCIVNLDATAEERTQQRIECLLAMAAPFGGVATVPGDAEEPDLVVVKFDRSA